MVKEYTRPKNYHRTFKIVPREFGITIIVNTSSSEIPSEF